MQNPSDFVVVHSVKKFIFELKCFDGVRITVLLFNYAELTIIKQLPHCEHIVIKLCAHCG